MADAMIALALIVALLLGPLAWAEWRDRLKARALAVRAEIQWVVNRELGGESLVSVEVTPRTPWRPGRVVLSVPTDWQRLVDSLWSPVLRHVPAGYELVIPAGARGPQPVENATTLKQAA